MDKKTYISDTYFLRRLLLSDLPDIENLYCALGADSVWIENNALKRIFAHGEVWGCVHKKQIVAVCGFCTFSANLPYVSMLFRHGIINKHDILIIPPCGNFVYFKSLLNLLQNILHTQYTGNRYVLCIPAKTGLRYAKVCFNCNMVLCAMRPLSHLRVNYIFFSKLHVQTNLISDLTINISNTLELSRCLEHGYCGVGLQNDNVLLEKKL